MISVNAFYQKCKYSRWSLLYSRAVFPGLSNRSLDEKFRLNVLTALNSGVLEVWSRSTDAARRSTILSTRACCDSAWLICRGLYSVKLVVVSVRLQNSDEFQRRDVSENYESFNVSSMYWYMKNFFFSKFYVLYIYNRYTYVWRAISQVVFAPLTCRRSGRTIVFRPWPRFT